MRGFRAGREPGARQASEGPLPITVEEMEEAKRRAGEKREGEASDEYFARVSGIVADVIGERPSESQGAPFVISYLKVAYIAGESNKARASRIEELKAAIAKLPHVEDAAITYGVPITRKDQDDFARDASKRTLAFMRDGWPPPGKAAADTTSS